MVGLMSYGPNLHGLRWFVREVLPALVEQLPEVELHVIGRHEAGLPEEFAGRPVRVRGFVQDLTTEYDQASLVVAPIFFGGGTQIKVIDALAHHRPLVASDFAQKGFGSDLRDGEHLLVARTAQEWISCCASMLRDPSRAEAMAGRGYTAARPYDSGGMITTIRQTIEALVQK
jgi:polysaccharide biosynthesis protein PslH